MNNMDSSRASDKFSDLVIKNASGMINGSEINASSPYLPIPLIVVCSLITIATVAGNVLVPTAIWRFPRLRTNSNLLILSLSITDLAVGAVNMPFTLTESNIHWNYNSVQCHIVRISNTTCCTVSILMLTIIALDKYIALKYPMKYRVKITCRVTVTVIIFAWVFGTSVSVGALYGFGTNNMAASDSAHCQSRYQILGTKSRILALCVPFYICVLAIVILYCCILRIALCHAKGSLSVRASHSTHRYLSNCAAELQRRKCHKAMRTTGILVGMFLICWLPFVLMMTIATLLHKQHHVNTTLKLILVWLGLCNSSINPALYALANKRFRNAFKAILCNYRRRFGSDATNTEMQYR